MPMTVRTSDLRLKALMRMRILLTKLKVRGFLKGMTEVVHYVH